MKSINIYKIIENFLSLTLISLLFLMTLFNPKTALAYYEDTEIISNIFKATLLDFRLTNNNLENFISSKISDKVSYISEVNSEADSLAMQYILGAEVVSTSTSVFCDSLSVEAKKNGTTQYVGPINGLIAATTTEFGTWEFDFNLTSEILVGHGTKCEMDVVFLAWRNDIIEPNNGDWFDEERLRLSLYAKTVVIKDAYPGPSEFQDQEYIELWNNGSEAVNVSGWQISEISESVENFYTITNVPGPNTATPYNSPTVILPNNSLKLILSNPIAIDDTGDTIRLYQDGNLLDSYLSPIFVAQNKILTVELETMGESEVIAEEKILEETEEPVIENSIENVSEEKNNLKEEIIEEQATKEDNEVEITLISESIPSD